MRCASVAHYFDQHMDSCFLLHWGLDLPPMQHGEQSYNRLLVLTIFPWGFRNTVRVPGSSSNALSASCLMLSSDILDLRFNRIIMIPRGRSEPARIKNAIFDFRIRGDLKGLDNAESLRDCFFNHLLPLPVPDASASIFAALVLPEVTTSSNVLVHHLLEPRFHWMFS